MNNAITAAEAKILLLAFDEHYGTDSEGRVGPPYPSGLSEEEYAAVNMQAMRDKLVALQYEVRDGQLEPAGCYDKSVDAVIFKDEHSGFGPLSIRRNRELTSYRNGSWLSLKRARALAEKENLPLGIV